MQTMQTIQNEAIRKKDGICNLQESLGIDMVAWCWGKKILFMWAGAKLCGCTVGKTVTQSFISHSVQILSMGMMTEYYHFFFTTLVRKLLSSHLFEISLKNTLFNILFDVWAQELWLLRFPFETGLKNLMDMCSGIMLRSYTLFYCLNQVSFYPT